MHKQKVMLQNVRLHKKFVRHRGRLQLAQRRPRITLTEHRYMLYKSLSSILRKRVQKVQIVA